MDKQEEPSRKLPFNFTNNPSNLKEGYGYCRHVKGYLFQQFQQCGKDNKELAAATGYANINKFQDHRLQWHGLSKPIPRKYLEAINVDINTLSVMLNMDRIDFDAAISLPRYYEWCTVRIMPAIYSKYSFGETVPEERAIKLMKAYAARINKKCMINLPGLCGTMVEPDGSVHRWNYYPKFDVTKAWVKFGWDGALLGTTMIR